MPSERVQRQIDRLLDEAEQAIAVSDWAQVQARCAQVEALDPGNIDAFAYRQAAARALGAAAPAGVVPPAPSLPAAFGGGRYEVLGLLGEGGRKIVYRAHDTRLTRDVAFALIKTEGLDTAERERVQREARTLGQLSSHPHIVVIHEVGDEAGRPFLVSELMQGGDVAQLISDAPEHRVPLQQVFAIGVGVAGALAFAHAKGVVHRDVKPGNVWLTAEGTPKLGDFGLAAVASDVRLTRAGMMVGTALYLAPEQAMGQAVTPRSDLYSLGCVLYELVTGRPPFVGDENVAIIGQHLNATPVAPSWHRPDCPLALEALILHLLAKDPAQRPAAADVVELLAAISAAPARTPSRSAPAAVPASGSANPVYRRIFVGREAELRQLEATFDAAASGQGGLVMVVGEPGIGKTTLTEQISTYAALRGGRTLVGHCYEEGSLSLPYLPFVEAMRSYVLEREPDKLKSELGSTASDVARIVSEVRDRVQVSPSQPAADPGEDRYRLFNAIASFLHNAGAVQPLIIVLEDLHDADRGTLELLQYLARGLQGARLLLVGTYRDVEVDRTHPLSGAVAELRRGGRLERIALRGLSIVEVQRMLATIAGQDVPWALAEAVHRQTEGNPLFVQEVIRYLAEEGLITRAGGRWRAAEGTSLLETIPEGLRDVIGKRLGRLSPECNRLLAIAAVIGRDFALATLQTVSGADEDGLAAALDEALKVAVLQDTSRPGSVRYRFAHAYFRQTLYEELITPRRLRLHQQVARALEQQYAGRLDEHAAELAEHFAQSSDPAELEKAVEYGARAARRALAVYAYGEAARLLEQALAVQEVLDPDNALVRCDLLLGLTETLPEAGESLRAFEQTAPAAFALAEQLGDRARAWRAAHAALTALRWYGDASIMVTHPASALWAERCAAKAAPGTRQQVLADVWLSRVYGGDTEHAREGAQARNRAWTLANELDDPEAWSEAAQGALVLTAENAGRALAAAEAIAGRPRDRLASRTAGEILVSACTTLLFCGRRRAAEALLAEVRAIGERSNSVRLQLRLENLGLFFLLIDGRLEEVLAAIEPLIEHGEALGMAQSARQTAILLQFWLQLLLGRPEEALQGNRAWMRFAGINPARKPVVSLAMEALALAHLGRSAEASRELSDSASWYGEPDEFSGIIFPTWALEAAILIEDGARVAGLAATLAPTATMALAIVAGCPARVLGDAMRFLGDHEQARLYYEQALAIAGGIDFRLEVALARLGLAALLATGDPAAQEEALEHLSFVIAEFEAMGMKPALAQALFLRGGLRPASASVGAQVAAEPQPSPASPAKQIFISYSSEERSRASELAALLDAAGQAVWLDNRSISGGASWDEEIVNGIRSCAVFILLCSRAAMSSPNVQQELRLAMQYRKPILPVRLDEAVAPAGMEYILAGRQWVEVLEFPREQWLPKILHALERLS